MIVVFYTRLCEYVSRHALFYGCMTSPMGRNDPGHVIWRHYQTCLTPELEVKSGILKEMLKLRNSNQEQIFNKEELETVIQFV